MKTGIIKYHDIDADSPSPAPVDGGMRWIKASEIDGYFMVNGSKERFKELEDKGWDWKSFYNGWLEGRADFSMKLNKSPLPVQQQPTLPTPSNVSPVSSNYGDVFDYSTDTKFWIRLRMFVNDIQVSDLMSEEEKAMILYVCDNKIPTPPKQ